MDINIKIVLSIALTKCNKQVCMGTGFNEKWQWKTEGNWRSIVETGP